MSLNHRPRVLISESGRPAKVAAPIRKLWLEKLPWIPASAKDRAEAREGFSVCKEEQRTGRIAAAMQVGGDAGLDKKKHARGSVKTVHRQVTDGQVNGGIKARGRGGEFADAQEAKPGCREGCPEYGTIGIGEV